VAYASNKKAWWICQRGHSWETKIGGRASPNGSNCPTCNTNKTEKRALEFLQAHPLVKSVFTEHPLKIYDPHEQRARRLRLDGFVCLVTGEEFGYELDGGAHFDENAFHSNPTRIEAQISSDLAKEGFFRDNEMNLIRIPYPEYSRVEVHLAEFVEKLSGSHDLPLQCYILPDMYFRRDELAESLAIT
jgi:hypothetical protein